MLSVKELLSRVENAKKGHDINWDDPSFIGIMCNQHRSIHMSEIDNSCPDEFFPMILEHSDYIDGIFIGGYLKREITIAQLIRDLLEKNPYLLVTIGRRSLPWVIACGFRFRKICIILGDDVDNHMSGLLLAAEGNNVEMLSVVWSSTVKIQDFVSYLEHPNCRVKEIRVDHRDVTMKRMMIRNTLIRRVVAFNFGSNDCLVWPHTVGENEFDTMIRVLREIRGSLPVDLWRVIFYFL